MKKFLILLSVFMIVFIASNNEQQDEIIRKDEGVTIYKNQLGYEYIKFNSRIKKYYMHNILIENYENIGKEYTISLKKNTPKRIYYFTGTSEWLDMPMLEEGLYKFEKVVNEDTYLGFSLSNNTDTAYICRVNGHIKHGKLTNGMKNVYMDNGIYVAEYLFDIETDYAIKHCFLVVQIDSFERYRMIWAL